MGKENVYSGGRGRRFGIGGLLLLCLIGCPRPEGQAVLAGTVTFHVVSPLGTVLNYRVAQFGTVGGEANDLAPHFQGLTGKGIPYSYYHYVLVPAGGEQRPYERITGDLPFYQAAAFHTLVVSDLIGDSEFAPIEGRSDPVPADHTRVWVRMQSIFGDGYGESAVDSGGRFRFYLIPRGRFLLIACTDAGVIGTKPLALAGSRYDIVVRTLKDGVLK